MNQKVIVTPPALEQAHVKALTVNEAVSISVTRPKMTEIESKTLTPAAPMSTNRIPAFYIASKWHIEAPKGSNVIEAVNNVTGDRFNGTIEEFNQMLKGK